MNAPEDPNGLREALAEVIQEWAGLKGDWRPWPSYAADALIAGPLASLIAERDDWRSQWEEMAELVCEFAAEKAPDALALVGADRDQCLRRALAAEPEITRLKEGMEALGAALKPFALGADIADADCLKCFAHLSYMDEQEIDPILPSGETPVLATLGDFRRARSALANLSPKEQP